MLGWPADASVDALPMGAVLAYVADKAAALNDFRRVLKPGCLKLEFTKAIHGDRRGMRRDSVYLIRSVPLRFRCWLACSLIVTAPGLLHAQPSVPWTPSAAVRADIEWLVDEAGLDLVVTQWPLPRAAVLHALDKLPARLDPALQFARERVENALAADLGSQVTLRLQGHADELVGFGDDSTRGSSIAVRSSTLQTDHVALRAGLRFDTVSGLNENPKLRFDDSALVTGALGIQLQAFSHRYWWGPGWQSSLTLGNNPPAFNGIGIQRASGSRSDSPWLAWLGPWNYDMFIAQTEDVSDPANPYFFGQRLTFRPFSNLEIGLTRTAQWGGRGRQQTFRSFLNMLTGRGVNADSSSQQAEDPANEEAGFDFRLRCPLGLRCAAYTQLTGEDQAGVLPSRYLGLYGLESWSADGKQRFYVEWAEVACSTPVGRPFLRNCAYRNYAYPQGYANAGRWIGSSVGPDSRLFTFGWADVLHGSSVRIDVGSAGSRIGTFSPLEGDPQTSGRLYGISAKQAFSWGAAVITPEVDWLHIAPPGGVKIQARIGATLVMGLDDAYQSGSSTLGMSLSGADSGSLRPLLTGVGLVAAAALLDRQVDGYVQRHAQNPSGRALGHIGSAVPIGAFGAAGLSWALQQRSVQGDLAWSALEAGVSAAGITEVAKFAIDRAAPGEDAGTYHIGGSRSKASFPSTHTAVAWAVLTPYAKYYDAPWLYGLASLTNAGRIASRDHWLSDTVAGSAIGYFLGDFFYRRSSASQDDSSPHVWITPRSVRIEKNF